MVGLIIYLMFVWCVGGERVEGHLLGHSQCAGQAPDSLRLHGRVKSILLQNVSFPKVTQSIIKMFSMTLTSFKTKANKMATFWKICS